MKCATTLTFEGKEYYMYKQGYSAWGSTYYDGGSFGSDYQNSACSVTSAAVLLSGYGYRGAKYNPLGLGTKAMNNGDTVSVDTVCTALKDAGVPATVSHDPKNAMKKAFSEGKPVVVLTYGITGNGHFVTVFGEYNGKVILDEVGWTGTRPGFMENEYTFPGNIDSFVSRASVDTVIVPNKAPEGSISKWRVYSVDKNHIMDIENEHVNIDATCSIIDEESDVTYSNSKDEHVIIKDGEIVEGNLNCEITQETNEGSEDGEESVLNSIGVGFDEEDVYTVEVNNPEEDLKANMYFKDSYLTAKTTAGGKAIFENKKSVKLENPTGKEFETSLTVNDEYLTMPWYVVTASGDGAKEIEIELTEEGVIISGDNLKNVKVCASNLDEQAELTLDTDETKVLLKASKNNKELVLAKNESISDVKDADLDVYEDKDKDGKFETKTQTATKSNLNNNNVNDDNTNIIKQLSIKAGDSIVFFVIILIVAGAVVAIIIYFKHKK